MQDVQTTFARGAPAGAIVARLTRLLESQVEERRRAEDELRFSRGRLTSILESAMDAVITVDSSRRVNFFSSARGQPRARGRSNPCPEPLDEPRVHRRERCI